MNKITIDSTYDIGDIVYLVTDPDRLERVVISITIIPQYIVTYQLACGSEVSTHYNYEICEQKYFGYSEN